MSIYASIKGIGDHGDPEHLGAPWTYQGSHILPADDHPRDGSIGLARIPSHITRDGRDDQPEDGRPWPWLRLSVIEDGVVIDKVINPAQARHLAEALAAWADQAEPSPDRCQHSFPDPHPQPLDTTNLTCRHCDTTYQAARTEHRIPLDHLTSDQYDALCDERDQLHRIHLNTLASLGIAAHRLDQIRDAARLHRQQLITTSELYAVIEADEPGPS